MSKIFEIINRICRKYPLYLLGGFCLTGLCFGAELFSGTLDRNPSANVQQLNIIGSDAEMTSGKQPLRGQGVMFFDQENQVVRKVDTFVCDANNPVGFGENQTPTAQEPKRLHFRLPDSVTQNMQSPDPQKDNAPNKASNGKSDGESIAIAIPSAAFPTQEYPTRFVSNETPNESGAGGQGTQTIQTYNYMSQRSAAIVDAPEFYVPITAPLPNASNEMPPTLPPSNATWPDAPPATASQETLIATAPAYLQNTYPGIENTAPGVPVQNLELAVQPPLEPAQQSQLQPQYQATAPLPVMTQQSTAMYAPPVSPPAPNDQQVAPMYIQPALPQVVTASETVAEQTSQDRNTLRIAMRTPQSEPENEIDEISTDTGDLYITREQLDEILNARDKSAPSAWGRKGPFTITPYGYINVSTSYESERTVRGDFALYSISPDLDGGGHSGFHIDPKSSRLGLKVDGPKLPWRCRCLETSALVEIDFQASNYAGTRNRGSVMLRRAFVDFTHEDTRLLIGQEWDVISPLVPQSLNYVPGSNAGNVGYRRAQIRLEKLHKWNSDFKTLWQIAVCDNVPTDFLTDSNVNIANSGWPMIQGRFATTFGRNSWADNQPYTVGISGHVGELTHDYRAYGINSRRHESWSANLDVDVPITSRLRFTTEMYTGTNLSPLLAGIGQGVDLFSPGSNAFDPRSAGAYGGWANLNFKMTKKFQMNAGYCVERMQDMIGGAPIGNNQYTARDKNQVLFLNGIYNWNETFLTGLEVSQWRTDWHVYDATADTIRDLEPGETTRIDFLVRYSF